MGLKKYRCLETCWFQFTRWEEGQVVQFDERLEVPHHFEEVEDPNIAARRVAQREAKARAAAARQAEPKKAESKAESRAESKAESEE